MEWTQQIGQQDGFVQNDDISIMQKKEDIPKGELKTLSEQEHYFLYLHCELHIPSRQYFMQFCMTA